MGFLSFQNFITPRNRRSSAALNRQTQSGLPGNRLPGDDQVLESLSDYIRHPQFKRLLNQILAAQAKANLNSIAIISEYPGEGKTFLVGALALAYAKFLNSKVLIVDTLNQPRKGKLYYECLAGAHGAEQYGPQLGTSQTGATIDFISAEDAQAASNSYDFHLGRYIQSLKKRYDVILFDTCALSAVTATNMDPLILGQYVDFSLLVTSPRSMKSSVMEGVARQFRKHNVEVVGTVYNPGVAV